MKNNLDELWRNVFGEKAAYEFASSATIRKLVNKKLIETQGERLCKCQKGVVISAMVMACTAVLLFACIYHATKQDRVVKTADPINEETTMVSEEKYASGGKMGQPASVIRMCMLLYLFERGRAGFFQGIF